MSHLKFTIIVIKLFYKTNVFKILSLLSWFKTNKRNHTQLTKKIYFRRLFKYYLKIKKYKSINKFISNIRLL